MELLYYVLALVAALMISSITLLQKQYQKNFGETLAAGFKFNAAMGAVAAVIFFFVCGMRVSFSFFSLLMAVTTALAVMLYTVLGFKLMQKGQVAVYSIFLMSGGMTVPYIFGLAFLGEAKNFKPLSLVGLILILIGCVLSSGSVKAEKKYIPLCIGVFFLNGITSVASKVHQVAGKTENAELSPLCGLLSDIGTVTSEEFVLFCGLAKLMIGLLALLVIVLLSKRGKDATSAKQELTPKLTKGKAALLFLVLSFVASVIDSIAYFILLVVAENVPATLQYPLITGGSIIFTALLAWAVIREKPGRNVIISLILCLVGCCMFI